MGSPTQANVAMWIDHDLHTLHQMLINDNAMPHVSKLAWKYVQKQKMHLGKKMGTVCTVS